MGAGKTFLMAAFMYLDLYFALNEPKNKAFAHNFIVLAPSGLKSSIIPSLKNIKNFDVSWILPEPMATSLKSMIKYEILDEVKTNKKSNQTENPNVQKIAQYQPYEDMFGIVFLTNAEKVILDKLKVDTQQLYIDFESSDDELTIGYKIANELREMIGKIPSKALFIDEVHLLKKGKDTRLIEISSEGLELIEMISLDCTSSDGVWHSDEEIRIDKFGYVIDKGIKTDKFWNGEVEFRKKPLRIKVRSISGDEIIVNI